MAISVTNIGTNNSKAVPNLGTLSITVPAGGVSSGALIVLGLTQTTGFVSMTDTASNTYSNGSGSALLYGGTPALDIGYVRNAAALVSGNSITFSAGTSGGGVVAMTAFYATGIQTASDPLDAWNTISTGNSSSPTATTNAGGSDSAGTTAVSGELLVGFVGTNGPSGDTFSQDTTNEGGFSASPAPVRVGTSGGGATSNDTIAGGFVVWNATGKPTYAPAVTSRAWNCSIIAFKPPAVTFVPGVEAIPGRLISVVAY